MSHLNIFSLLLALTAQIPQARAHIEETPSSIAIEAFNRGVRNPSSQLGRAHRKMLETYGRNSAEEASALPLTTIETASDISVILLVVKRYEELTAGGKIGGSISTKFEVNLKRNADDGEITEKEAHLVLKSVNFHHP